MRFRGIGRVHNLTRIHECHCVFLPQQLTNNARCYGLSYIHIYKLRLTRQFSPISWCFLLLSLKLLNYPWCSVVCFVDPPKKIMYFSFLSLDVCALSTHAVRCCNCWHICVLELEMALRCSFFSFLLWFPRVIWKCFDEITSHAFLVTNATWNFRWVGETP